LRDRPHFDHGRGGNDKYTGPAILAAITLFGVIMADWISEAIRVARFSDSTPVARYDPITRIVGTIVALIHPKAMPVILTTPAECDRWLEADTSDALALRRPLPDDALHIVAKGEKEDRSAEIQL
jgi:putative SOS response-associated peptidase YedK